MGAKSVCSEVKEAMNAIELDAIGKVYRRQWGRGEHTAVRALSLTIGQGEVFGFIGPNGAGKSTTIKILIGTLLPTSGSATLFGTSVSVPESRRGLGFVPENPSLQEHLTPYEILLMGLRLHGVHVREPRRHCMAWLDRLDLLGVADTPVRGFSKGMAQRTALAHALAILPRLLILDEPLSGLDPIGRRDVVDILAEYRRQGGTLFFSSHVLHDVERLADRYGLIHQGVLRAVRSPAELIGEDDRVVVRSSGLEGVTGQRREGVDTWVIEVSRIELWAVLEAIRGAGQVLLDVKPVLSLERAFIQVVSTGSVS